MNVEHRTLNVQHRIMNSISLKKTEQSNSSKFDSAESFDPEFFNSELTTEGLIAGCGSVFYSLFVLKSLKRSLRLVGVVAPTPRRASSIFDVQCWTFDVRRSICSLFLPGGGS